MPRTETFAPVTWLKTTTHTRPCAHGVVDKKAKAPLLRPRLDLSILALSPNFPKTTPNNCHVHHQALPLHAPSGYRSSHFLPTFPRWPTSGLTPVLMTDIPISVGGEQKLKMTIYPWPERYNVRINVTKPSTLPSATSRSLQSSIPDNNRQILPRHKYDPLSG